VARFASRSRAILPLQRHPLAELPIVRIRVATGARTIVEAIFHGRGRSHGNGFVTIRAQNCQMCARQRKTRLPVANQRKVRGLESLQVVTRFATVLVWRVGKLSFVNIFVTVLAFRARDFEYCVCTFRTLGHVALFASDGNMAAFQRIFCGRVIFDGERRRLETLDRVAGSTLSAICASAELAFVRIFVAIRALREWHWSFEISVRVAIGASHRRVLAKQRIFCFGVIESLQLSDLMPVARAVARLTSRGKTSLVRIGVTRRAFRKGQTRVFHKRFGIGDRAMAFRARCFSMRSGQRIFCPGMAEK